MKVVRQNHWKWLEEHLWEVNAAFEIELQIDTLEAREQAENCIEIMIQRKSLTMPLKESTSGENMPLRYSATKDMQPVYPVNMCIFPNCIVPIINIQSDLCLR